MLAVQLDRDHGDIVLGAERELRCRVQSSFSERPSPMGSPAPGPVASPVVHQPVHQSTDAARVDRQCGLVFHFGAVM